MSTRVTGGARRERNVTESEEKERLLAVHAIAKNCAKQAQTRVPGGGGERHPYETDGDARRKF